MKRELYKRLSLFIVSQSFQRRMEKTLILILAIVLATLSYLEIIGQSNAALPFNLYFASSSLIAAVLSAYLIREVWIYRRFHSLGDSCTVEY